MVQPHRAGTSSFVGDALAALRIGIWSWRGSPATVQSCPVTAHLFGVSAAEAWDGLPLERFAAGVHPEDRTYFKDSIKEAQQSGGPFVAQYRTLDELGTTRSVLDRGEFELGSDGHVVAARGIVVDMTDRSAGVEIQHHMPAVPNFAGLPPLHQAVEHALALHKLIGVLPEGRQPLAEMLLRAMLEMLGNEVAASIKWPEHRPLDVRKDVH